MTRPELNLLQAHLRKLLGNQRIVLEMPARPKGSVEMLIGDEFVGTVHRDAEDGEVSYHVQIVVLAEDMT
jgi:hypothetical protein